MADNGEKKCPFCAETIKAEALKCRFCGEKLCVEGGEVRPHTTAQASGNKAGKIILWIILTPVLGLLGMMLLGSIIQGTETPEDRARKSAAHAIELCWKDVNDDLAERSTRRFVRGVCEKMESDFHQKYNRNP